MESEGERKSERGVFHSKFSEENMYVVLERNHAFLSLKHWVHSVLEIQAINSDYTFDYPSPKSSTILSRRGAPMS